MVLAFLFRVQTCREPLQHSPCISIPCYNMSEERYNTVPVFLCNVMTCRLHVTTLSLSQRDRMAPVAQSPFYGVSVSRDPPQLLYTKRFKLVTSLLCLMYNPEQGAGPRAGPEPHGFQRPQAPYE